jgi:Asp-tRNA(Asn)/Glu-tRNA(Gln) amidotransferase B subunit
MTNAHSVNPWAATPLTGQVMKAAATKPDPKQVTELLRARLL